MILVDSEPGPLKEIRLIKNGVQVALTPESDPKALYSALVELARFIIAMEKTSKDDR